MATFINDTKTYNLNKAAPSTWRKLFLINLNPIYKKKTKLVFDRGSIVPQSFVGQKIKIYSGNKYHSRIVNRWMVGFKHGEFSWTRKLALYKAKQLKKKKK